MEPHPSPLRSLDGITRRSLRQSNAMPATSHQDPSLWLRRIGKTATILRYPALVVTLGLAIWPFLPMLEPLQRSAVQQIPVAQANIASPSPSLSGGAVTPTSQTHTLEIESIGLNETILEGTNEDILDQGVWHLPNTGAPDTGSNMVLGGHRFAYTTKANSFYHLPEVKVGDSIVVTWSGKVYTYKITTTKTIGPTDLSIEDATSTPTLTLFTCTPLLTGTNRFVVQANLQSVS